MTSNSDPRLVKAEDFPKSGTVKQQLQFLLNYAVLAPSGHNAQPWLFRMTHNSVELIFNRSRALAVIDPDNREMTISCGAALGNLEVAARYFGFQPVIQLSSYENTPDCLATITLVKGSAPSESDIALFKAITVRQTNRRPFSSEKLSEEILKLCVNTAANFAVNFSYHSNQKIKAEIAKLTMFADKRQFAKPWFRIELATWMHSNKRGEKDGMSAYRFGLPDVFTPLTSFIIKTFNLGNRVAQSNKRKIQESSPVLGVFSSVQDQQEDWINTGRALAQVLLIFTSVGFSASYLNQSIETGSLRKLLQQEFSVSDYPQIMVRIGRADPAEFSVRRSVEDCLVDTNPSK